MTGNVESKKLAVDVIARIDKLEKAMAKAANVTNKSMSQVERRTKSAADAINNNFGRLGKVFAGAAAVKGAQSLIDTATRIDNALKVTGVSGAELNKVYQSLYASAQKNAAPLEALVQLYGRASLVQKELRVSTQELLRFTDNVSTALRVSGKSAAESSGALLQLSQALGSGVVRAEEFNSMLEGALPIVQAAANGITEAGGSVSKLRQLVVEGKVSSEAFFRGFQSGAVMLNQQVAGASYTVAQGFERLQNAAIDAAKKINDAAGVSKTTTNVLDALAAVVTRLGEAFASLAGDKGIKETADRIDGIGVAARNLWNDPSFQNLYEFLFDTSGSKAKSAANDAIDARIKGIDALRKAMQAANAEAAKASTKDGKPTRFDAAFSAFAPKKISLKDYAVKGDDKNGAAGDRDAFERRLAMTQRQIDLMGVEARTIDMNAAARDRARVVVELETAARRANEDAGLKNIEVSVKQREQINALADAYAKARGQLEQLNGPLATFARESANVGQQLENLAANSLDRIANDFGDIVAGTKTVEDAFRSMAQSIISELAKIAIKKAILGPLASLMGGGGFGMPMNILPTGFSAGGYTGPGGRNQPAGVVHRGEVVWSQKDVARAGGVAAVEAMRLGLRGYADGGLVGGAPTLPRLAAQSPQVGSTHVTVGVSVDDQGNLQAYVKDVARQTAASSIRGFAGSEEFKTRAFAGSQQRTRQRWGR